MKINFAIKEDDLLWYGKRLCELNESKLKREIMEEAHGTLDSVYSVCNGIVEELFYRRNNLGRQKWDKGKVS